MQVGGKAGRKGAIQQAGHAQGVERGVGQAVCREKVSPAGKATEV